MALGDIVRRSAYMQSGTSVTVSTSQGQSTSWVTPTAGNLLVALVWSGGGTVTAPSGWTQRYSDITAGNFRRYIYEKVSAGNESSLTINFSASENHGLILYQLEGVPVFDRVASARSTTGVTSIASGSTGTLAGSKSTALVYSHHWAVSNTSFDSSFTLDGHYASGSNGTLYYTGYGSRLLSSNSALNVTASWTGSSGGSCNLIIYNTEPAGTHVEVGGRPAQMSLSGPGGDIRHTLRAFARPDGIVFAAPMAQVDAQVVSISVEVDGQPAALTLGAPSSDVGVTTNIEVGAIPAHAVVGAPSHALTIGTGPTVLGTPAQLTVGAPAHTVATTATVIVDGQPGALSLTGPPPEAHLTGGAITYGEAAHLVFAAPMHAVVVDTGIVVAGLPAQMSVGAPSVLVETSIIVQVAPLPAQSLFGAPAALVTTTRSATVDSGPGVLILVSPSHEVEADRDATINASGGGLILGAPSGTATGGIADQSVSIDGIPGSLILGAPEGTFSEVLRVRPSPGALVMTLPSGAIPADFLFYSGGNHISFTGPPAHIIAGTNFVEVHPRSGQLIVGGSSAFIGAGGDSIMDAEPAALTFTGPAPLLHATSQVDRDLRHSNETQVVGRSRQPGTVGHSNESDITGESNEVSSTGRAT